MRAGVRACVRVRVCSDQTVYMNMSGLSKASLRPALLRHTTPVQTRNVTDHVFDILTQEPLDRISRCASAFVCRTTGPS